MKALLYKDFCQSRPLAAALIAAPLLFIAAPFHWTIMAFWALFAGCMVPLTQAFSDERDKWNELLPMLPYSPRDVILSRYLFGWLETALVGLVLMLDLACFGGYSLGGLFSGRPPFQFFADLTTVLFTLALALVFQAVFFLILANSGGNSAASAGAALLLMAAMVLALLSPYLQNLDRPLAGPAVLAGGAVLNLASASLAVKRYASAFAPKERNSV